MATTLLLLSVLLQPAPSGFSAAVMNVSDGDTLTVLRADHVRVKIRIHGVDAPELGQDWGRRAKEFATELAAGKPVAILPRDTDRYGRTVAEVRLPDGRSLGVEMTRAGTAWHHVRYAPGDDELARAKAEARKARAGVWSTPDPVPPWEFRRGRGEKATAKVVGNRVEFEAAATAAAADCVAKTHNGRPGLGGGGTSRL